MTDSHSSEIRTDELDCHEPLHKARAQGPLKDGMTAEYMLGLFADDIDDEFFEALRWIRGRPRLDGTKT